MSKVAVQQEAKGNAIGNIFNIKGAVDSTSAEAKKQEMIRLEVPEVLMDWVVDLLAHWNLIVSHVDTTIEGKPG